MMCIFHLISSRSIYGPSLHTFILLVRRFLAFNIWIFLLTIYVSSFLKLFLLLNLELFILSLSVGIVLHVQVIKLLLAFLMQLVIVLDLLQLLSEGRLLRVEICLILSLILFMLCLNLPLLIFSDLLPHLLSSSPLLLSDMLSLLFKPFFFFFGSLNFLRLNIAFKVSFSVNFLTNTLVLSFSRLSLLLFICSLFRIFFIFARIILVRGVLHIPNISIITQFKVRILEYLVGLLDFNEFIIEFTILTKFTQTNILSCLYIWVILECESPKLIFNLIQIRIFAQPQQLVKVLSTEINLILSVTLSIMVRLRILPVGAMVRIRARRMDAKAQPSLLI